jgi:hypothetical protein
MNPQKVAIFVQSVHAIGEVIKQQKNRTGHSRELCTLRAGRSLFPQNCGFRASGRCLTGHAFRSPGLLLSGFLQLVYSFAQRRTITVRFSRCGTADVEPDTDLLIGHFAKILQ